MAIGNKENVYIQVDSIGVQAAVAKINEIVGPLEAATKKMQDFQKASNGFALPGLANDFTKIDKSTDKFIKQQKDFQKESIATQKQLAEMIENIDDRMARAKFFNLLKGGMGLFGGMFDKSAIPLLLGGLGTAATSVQSIAKMVSGNAGSIADGFKLAGNHIKTIGLEAVNISSKTLPKILNITKEIAQIPASTLGGMEYFRQQHEEFINRFENVPENIKERFIRESGSLKTVFGEVSKGTIKSAKIELSSLFSVTKENIKGLGGEFKAALGEVQKGFAIAGKDSLIGQINALPAGEATGKFKEIINGSEEAKNAIYTLSQAFPMLGKSLAGNIPILSQLSSMIAKGLGPAFLLLKKSFTETKKTVGELLGSLGTLIKSVPLSGWLKMANQGFAQMVSLAGKATSAFADFTKKLLANPFALIAGSIAAAVYGLKEFAESCWDDIKAFDKLHPEITTVIDEMDELKIGTEATSLALSSISGKALNDTFMPIVKEATTTIRNITDSFKQWLALLTSGDFSNAFKKLAFDWGKASSTILGTVATVGESFENLFGVKNGYFSKASDTWAEVSYHAGKTSDEIFKQSEIGKQYDDELKLAEDYLRNQAKEAEKTKKNLAGAKNELKEFSNILSNITVVDNGDSFRIWDTKILGDFDKLKESYQAQLEELAKMDEYTEEEKERAKLAIDEEYLNKSRELQLANARAVGDNEYIIAQQLADKRIEIQKEQEAERQRLAEERAAAEQALIDELIAKQQEQLEAWVQKQKDQLEWINGYVTGPLSDGIADVLASAIEGTESLGSMIFDTLYSIAKNIFTDSISNLINAALLAVMNQYESNSKLGLPGLAIATAASASIMGIMAGIKAKMQPPKKAKMAVGGYVSSGMVKGAYSGDSVEALLQPGERVLSKEETKAYDKGKNQTNQIVNINVSINGGFDKNTIATEVRQYLIPEIKRALGQGYNLLPA